ncbi:MAG: indole-3-glycerol phosphate synthase TrpC [Bacteroidota bacterium]
MTTFLENIVANKKVEIEHSKAQISLEQIRLRAEKSERPRDFRGALLKNDIACIAEIKKASPSRGVLINDFHPQTIAFDYTTGGASAISVLTERQYFQGYSEAIREVKNASILPVLRKDFVIDEYQIFESRALGADAILLIVNILDSASIGQFLRQANDLEMQCLVEVHTKNEISRAVDAGAEIIGINNRDLHSFNVNLDTSFRLRESVPDGRICVSESGIQNHEQVLQLFQAGFQAILVGEQLMTASDRTAALRSLLRG